MNTAPTRLSEPQLPLHYLSLSVPPYAGDTHTLRVVAQTNEHAIQEVRSVILFVYGLWEDVLWPLNSLTDLLSMM